ncbi:MAG: heptaprenylglyceryl phosphate synthase [Bacillota bacterium]
MWSSENWKWWRLVAKLDPDKTLPPGTLEALAEGGFDAVIVGGTQGISYSNTSNLVRLVRDSGYAGPLVQEISAEDAVVPGVDAHFIPVVLNAGDVRWLSGAHLEAIKRYRGLIQWDRVLTEGYLVCNGDSAVGRLTGAGEVTEEDAAAYAVLAEEIYRLPLLYVEYSGKFGDLDLVRAVSKSRKKIHLFYGGGIKTPEQIQLLASLVDTVVIGNMFYDNPAGIRELLK